jgi:serine/threonine protein kinase
MTRPLPQIPSYTILEKLGEGGMASVWLAQRRADSRLSVIKVLHEHLSADPVVGSRFLREAEIASLLDHPNIARLYDAGRAGDLAYLAMELIKGVDLESIVLALSTRAQPLPPSLAIAIMLRALNGIHYAHEFCDADGRHLEIVHRDLSPRNIMVSFDGDVKIIDFGLVRTNLGDFRTTPGMIQGTLRYMSPEQASGSPVDRRSDIYTCGVVLYELLSGRTLVDGPTPKNILMDVVTKEAPPLSEANPALPSSLDPVLQRALDKDTDRRFQTAQAFQAALAGAARSLPSVMEEDIATFLRSLLPEKRIEADARAARLSVDDSLPVESTRVAASRDVRTEVVRRSAFAAAPPARRARPIWLIPVAAALLAVTTVVVTNTTPPVVISEAPVDSPGDPSIKPAEATSRATFARSPVDAPGDPSIEPAVAPMPRKPIERQPNVERKILPSRSPPPPPVPPSVSATARPDQMGSDDEARRFVDETKAAVGEEAAKRILEKCGLLLHLGSDSVDQPFANMEACRALVKAELEPR